MRALSTTEIGAFREIRDGIIFAKSNKVLYANRSACEILGELKPGDDYTKTLPRELRDIADKTESGNTDEYPLTINGKNYLMKVSALTRYNVISISNAFSVEKFFNSRIPEIYHEVNMPLTIIFSTLSLLSKKLRDVEDEKIKQYLSIINNSCYRIMRISGNVLNLSQFASSKDQFFPRPLHLQPFLSRVVESVMPYAATLNVPVEFKNMSKPIWINADAELLERLVLNLISNSFKFTRDGNRIEIALSSDRDNIKISVSDKGSGIERDKCENLFKSVVSSGEGGHSSYGIGLLIVNTIALLHKGRMTVESVPGEGTTMTLVMPNQKADSGIVSAYKMPYVSRGGFRQPYIEFSKIFSADPQKHYEL